MSTVVDTRPYNRTVALPSKRKTLEECLVKLDNKQGLESDRRTLYCNVTTDDLLCWPKTLAGTTVRQPCPSFEGSNSSRFAYRTCNLRGEWSSRWNNGSSAWTNYTQCHHSEAELIFQFDSRNIRKATSEDLTDTSILGICGLSMSLLAVFFTLAYVRYKKYSGPRIDVYRNLFATLVLEASVKLSFQIILLMVWVEDGFVVTVFDIPHLCKIFVIILEFAEITTYIWTALHGHLSYLEVKQYDPLKVQVLYAVLGWGLPIITLAEWLAVQATTNNAPCWYGYRFQQSAWILEVPRVWSLIFSLVFLAYTIWSLNETGHMRDVSEVQMIRRSTLACLAYIFFLTMSFCTTLVLANLTHNSINTMHLLALIYTITFLTSFRGLFFAIGYWLWDNQGRIWYQKVSLV
ncbi:PDF receptor [Argonauta hians]